MDQTNGKDTTGFSKDPCWNKWPAVRANKREKTGFSWLAEGRKVMMLRDSLAGSRIWKGNRGKFHTDDAHQGFVNAMLAFLACTEKSSFHT